MNITIADQPEQIAIQQSPTDKTIDERNRTGVCITTQILLYKDSNYTAEYAQGVLKTLRNVALKSIRMQTLSPTIKSVVIELSFFSWRTYFATRKEMEVFFADDSFSGIPLRILTDETKTHQVDNQNCQWVAFIRLDADDALGADYFNYLGEHIVPEILEKDDAWLAGIVASTYLPVLYFGFDRCELNLKPFDYTHYSGWSIGQTRIYRYNVYQSLTHKKTAQVVSHVKTLEHVRNMVIHNFMGNASYKSSIQSKSDNLTYRVLDENRSKVKMIDVSKIGYSKPLGIYYQTPLSGNFPWSTIFDKPKCTQEQQRSILKQYNYTLDYSFIFDRTNIEDVTPKDACLSNVHFARVQGELFRRSHSDNCEGVAAYWKRTTAKK